MISIEGNEYSLNTNNNDEGKEEKMNYSPGINRKMEQQCINPEMLAQMLHRVKRNYGEDIFQLPKRRPYHQKRFQMYNRHILGHLKK